LNGRNQISVVVSVTARGLLLRTRRRRGGVRDTERREREGDDAGDRRHNSNPSDGTEVSVLTFDAACSLDAHVRLP
jgi:hypothetical protein